MVKFFETWLKFNEQLVAGCPFTVRQITFERYEVLNAATKTGTGFIGDALCALKEAIRLNEVTY